MNISKFVVNWRFKINQLIEFNTGNSKWISGKVIMFSENPDRCCIKLDEIWRGDDEWWVNNHDLRFKK